MIALYSVLCGCILGLCSIRPLFGTVPDDCVSSGTQPSFLLLSVADLWRLVDATNGIVSFCWWRVLLFRCDLRDSIFFVAWHFNFITSTSRIYFIQLFFCMSESMISHKVVERFWWSYLEGLWCVIRKELITGFQFSEIQGLSRLALNSRPALKSPWISENWKSPWIVLEKEWKASKSSEFVHRESFDKTWWLCELPAIVAVKLVEELFRPFY